MKTEKQLIAELIILHQKQIESLQKKDSNSLFEYRCIRNEITMLESVLELNVYNR